MIPKEAQERWEITALLIAGVGWQRITPASAWMHAEDGEIEYRPWPENPDKRWWHGHAEHRIKAEVVVGYSRDPDKIVEAIDELVDAIYVDSLSGGGERFAGLWGFPPQLCRWYAEYRPYAPSQPWKDYLIARAEQWDAYVRKEPRRKIPGPPRSDPRAPVTPGLT